MQSGTIFGPYTITRLIGRGGMGEVYEAVERNLERQVAIKVISPRQTPSSGGDPLTRFLTEAKTMARLNHPNVVTIHAIQQIAETHVLSLEYINGVTMRDLFNVFVLSGDEAAPLFIQMLKGLRALHEKGVLHRDLTPNNIMVNVDGQIKILDFGIARRSGDSPAAKEHLMGTMAYLPPEVVGGQRADMRSDLWCLGAIFYECLVGFPLISMSKTRVTGVRSSMDSDILFPMECLWRVPEGLRLIISKLCATDPVERYQTIGEAMTDMTKYLKTRPPPPPPFMRLLSRAAGDMASILAHIDYKPLPNPDMKRALTVELMGGEDAVAAEAPTITMATPLPDDVETVVLDSIEDRQKRRKKLRNRRRRTGDSRVRRLIPTIVLGSSLGLLAGGVIIWILARAGDGHGPMQAKYEVAAPFTREVPPPPKALPPPPPPPAVAHVEPPPPAPAPAPAPVHFNPPTPAPQPVAAHSEAAPPKEESALAHVEWPPKPVVTHKAKTKPKPAKIAEEKPKPKSKLNEAAPKPAAAAEPPQHRQPAAVAPLPKAKPEPFSFKAPLLTSTYTYNPVNHFEWEEVPQATRYLVQYSETPDMANAHTKFTNGPKSSLPNYTRQLYVRVAVADENGHAVSPYSRVTRVTGLASDLP